MPESGVKVIMGRCMGETSLPRRAMKRVSAWSWRRMLRLCIGRVRAKFSSDASRNTWAAFHLRQALFLREKYPSLSQMKLSLNKETAEHVQRFFLEIIPAIDEQAREVCIRNALYRLRLSTQDPTLRHEVVLEIARSDLRSGIPDRALVLRDDEMLQNDLESQLRQSDKAYGAPLLGRAWPDVSRGRTLCYYFQNHKDLLKGKAILHLSPESELRAWMLERSSALSFDYTTSDITGEDVDIEQDLTCITRNEDYDIIICHRVMEHVLDDLTALGELFRITRPGGCLQISVPQSMHQETQEWVVPDLTHHQHVRHYGRDFRQRLISVGFEVETCHWLMEQSEEKLLANGAYPLRMYMARKPQVKSRGG